MTTPGLLDGAAIKALIAEVAGELGDGSTQHLVVVVGGSLLAWHGLRASTADVDSIRKLDVEVRAAVRAVAERHGLDVGWMNDFAAPFAPQSLDIAACDVLFDHPHLRVLGPPLRDVFLMKLGRADPQDLEDLRNDVALRVRRVRQRASGDGRVRRRVPCGTGGPVPRAVARRRARTWRTRARVRLTSRGWS